MDARRYISTHTYPYTPILGVRNSKTKALMGCITAIPVEVRVYDQVVPMAEINFLCVHKKLRTKRLAPVLIKVSMDGTYLVCVYIYICLLYLPYPYPYIYLYSYHTHIYTHTYTYTNTHS
ncbi:hypothetical protein EON63_06425 [archaeon]|nr:MAG: hypothetical protein EON63_06425 [archaeon]